MSNDDEYFFRFISMFVLWCCHLQKHIKSNVDDDIDEDLGYEDNNNSTKESALADVKTQVV